MPSSVATPSSGLWIALVGLLVWSPLSAAASRTQTEQRHLPGRILKNRFQALDKELRALRAECSTNHDPDNRCTEASSLDRENCIMRYGLSANGRSI